MTPQYEKAQSLVNSFKDILPTIRNEHLEIGESDDETAKKCAIKVCDEIIALPGMNKNKFWKEVRLTIQKNF